MVCVCCLGKKTTKTAALRSQFLQALIEAAKTHAETLLKTGLSPGQHSRFYKELWKTISPEWQVLKREVRLQRAVRIWKASISEDLRERLVKNSGILDTPPSSNHHSNTAIHSFVNEQQDSAANSTFPKSVSEDANFQQTDVFNAQVKPDEVQAIQGLPEFGDQLKKIAIQYNHEFLGLKQ